MDSQFHAAPFPALTLQLLTVTGSALIQLCLLNTSATCLPFFLRVFLFFPDLDLCLTASSLFLFSCNNESSLSCHCLLKPGSSFLQSSSW